LLILLTHRLALPVLKLVRRPEVFPYTREQLQALPEGSLGRDLANMLEANRFELLTHYAKHDMKHILLDYPTTDKGEVCLQAFMLGNGHISFPVASTLAFGMLTMPEYWRAFQTAWRRGKQAPAISGWNWAELVGLSTLALKQRIFNTSTQH
jgi:ubiquinone biosynthesis protein Coq4